MSVPPQSQIRRQSARRFQEAVADLLQKAEADPKAPKFTLVRETEDGNEECALADLGRQGGTYKLLTDKGLTFAQCIVGETRGPRMGEAGGQGYGSPGALQGTIAHEIHRLNEGWAQQVGHATNHTQFYMERDRQHLETEEKLRQTIRERDNTIAELIMKGEENENELVTLAKDLVPLFFDNQQRQSLVEKFNKIAPKLSKEAQAEVAAALAADMTTH